MLVVLLLAAALRLIYLYQYYQSPFWEQLTVDNWYHHHWAQSLADGNIVGDTTYFRAPLYVYCLGLLYALFGSSLWVGRLFGLAIGLTSVGMTYLLGRRLFGKPAAILAALLHAVLPIAIYFESELLLDPLFTLLLQVALWRFLIWSETEQPRDLFLTALVFGLAAICRPTALAVAAVALAWALSGQPRQRYLRHTWWRLNRLALFAIGLSVCIGPVFLRNIAVAGDPVLIASQGGINLYIGNNESADGLSAVLPEPLGHNWQIGQITYLAESKLARELKPGEVSGYWQQKALDWILSHPEDFLSLLGRKLIFLISNREIPNERSLEMHFASFLLLGRNPLVFGLIFPLALVGIMLHWRHQPTVQFLAVTIAVFMLAVALFFVNSRFRLPLMPLLCLLAAGGLARMSVVARTRPLLALGAGAVMVAVGWFSFRPPLTYPSQWSAQSMTSRGLYLYFKGEYGEAVSLFRKAADLQPDFPEVNLNLGATYLRLGMTDSARVCFERETTGHPMRHKAYQNLASLQLLSGEIERAAQLAEQALSRAPYDVLSNLIRLRAFGSNSSADITSLRNEIKLSAMRTSDDLEVLNEGAGQLVNRNDIPGALGWLNRAEIAMPPPIETDDDAFGPGFKHGRGEFERTRAETYYLMGYCYARLDRLADAVAYTGRAIAADSMLVEAYLNLRSGYLAQGRLVQADSVLKEATRRFPNHELVRTALQARPRTE